MNEEHLEGIKTVIPGHWDVDAIRAGAMVCLAFAVPFTIVAAIVDSESGALNALFFFGAMFGFIVGSGCAAWVQRAGTPMSHALVTAGGTYLAVQGILIVIRLVRGNDVNWFGVFFTLSLVLVAGVIGGFLGNRLQTNGFRASSMRR